MLAAAYIRRKGEAQGCNCHGQTLVLIMQYEGSGERQKKKIGELGSDSFSYQFLRRVLW